MILTDNEIRKYTSLKESLIEGFKEDSLQSESYDLSLGRRVSRLDPRFKILYLDQQDSIDNLYLEEPLLDNGYLLGPGEYILVSIDEKINMPVDITAHIRPRTKFTRIGLLVSNQHINSSYSGNLTLGLYNATAFSICIKPGMKIAQIVFEKLQSVPSVEKQYRKKTSATFQDETAIQGSDFSKEYAQTESQKVSFFKRLKQDPEVMRAYKLLTEEMEGRDK